MGDAAAYTYREASTHRPSIDLMRSLQRVLFLVAAFAFLPEGATQELGTGACKADAEKLCKDVQPGEGRLARCLKQHEASVSPPCKEAMFEARKKMQALREACADDAKQYCRGVKHGRGRMLTCLKQNEAKLSDACRRAMQGAQGEGTQK